MSPSCQQGTVQTGVGFIMVSIVFTEHRLGSAGSLNDGIAQLPQLFAAVYGIHIPISMDYTRSIIYRVIGCL